MSVRNVETADDVVRQAVARSFESMQSRELRPPDEAGAHAAHAAFQVALAKDVERRSRRRPARKRGDRASAGSSDGG